MAFPLKIEPNKVNKIEKINNLNNISSQIPAPIQRYKFKSKLSWYKYFGVLKILELFNKTSIKKPNKMPSISIIIKKLYLIGNLFFSDLLTKKIKK